MLDLIRAVVADLCNLPARSLMTPVASDVNPVDSRPNTRLKATSAPNDVDAKPHNKKTLKPLAERLIAATV